MAVIVSDNGMSGVANTVDEFINDEAYQITGFMMYCYESQNIVRWDGSNWEIERTPRIILKSTEPLNPNSGDIWIQTA